MPARQTTHLEFRAAGNSDIEQALRDIGITGTDSLERLEKLTANLNKQLAATSRQSRNVQTGVGNIGKELRRNVAGYASVGVLTSGLTSATHSLIDFETELASVGTLLGRGVDDLGDYRRGLIALDPQLGTTSRLTSGLYQTISAGIEDDPLRFLATSATLATAGLTETRVAVDALSTITKGFGEDTSLVTRNADDFFTTVQLGKTTVEELAQQVGSTIPLAANLGFEFVDIASAMAALTQGGLSTDKAATALRSTFQQLISRTVEFSKAGIDLQQVIGDRGIIGVMEELQRVTGGNSTEMRKYIQDTEGLVGVLALSGNQFDELQAAMDRMLNNDGASLKAFQIQSGTTAGAWRLFVGEIDRFIQESGPLILPQLATSVGFLADLARQVRGVELDRLGEVRQEIKRISDEIKNFPNVKPIDFFNKDAKREREEQIGLLREERAALISLAQAYGDAATEREAFDTEFDPQNGTEESIEQLRQIEVFNEKINNQLLRLRDSTAANIADIKRENDVLTSQAQALGADLEQVEKLNQAKITEALKSQNEERRREQERAAKERERQVERQKKAELQALQEFTNAIAAGEEELTKMTEERLEEEERLSRDALRIRLDMIQEESDAYTASLERQLNKAIEAKEARDKIAEDEADKQIRELERAQARYDDFVSDTVENFVEALGNGDIVDGFKSLAQDLVNENVFEDLYKDISDNLQNAFSSFGIGASSPEINISAQSSGASQQADTIGGAIAQQSDTQGGEQQSGGGGGFLSGLGGIGGGIGIQGSLDGLFNGGNFRDTTYGQLFGFTGNDTAQNVLGGAANGAAAGAAVGGPWGALVGGLAGALAGGLNVVFGGREGSRAELVTGNVDQDLLSDRASRRGAFGQVGFLNEGSLRLDAGRAAGVIANIDDEIANLISDRQEAIVAEVIQQQQSAQGGSELFSGDDEQDIVAQIIKSRLDDTLNALGGAGFSDQVFGDYEVSVDNVESITETFRDALDVLGALDAIRNPVENITIAEQAIDVINDRFDDLTDNATRFGLAASEVAEIEAERAAQLSALGTDFDAQIAEQALAITDAYQSSVNNLFSVGEDRLREAIAAGGSPADALRLALLEQQQLQTQFVNSQTSVILENLNRLEGLLDGAENFTEAERKFRSLTDQFGEMRDAAIEAGFAIGEVTSAYQQSVNDVTRDINRDIQQGILEFTDPFEAAIRELFERQTEEFRNVESAGGNIAGLLQLQRHQQQELFDDFNSSIAESSSAITDFLGELGTSERSGLGVQVRLTNANELFQAALKGTDENEAVAAAGTLIDLFRERFGSATGFTEGREAVITALESFRGRQSVAGEEQGDFEAFLARFEDIQHQENEEQFGGLREVLEEQRRAEESEVARQTEIARQNGVALEAILAILEDQGDRGALDTSALQTIIENTGKSSDLTRRMVDLLSQLTAEQAAG